MRSNRLVLPIVRMTVTLMTLSTLHPPAAAQAGDPAVPDEVVPADHREQGNASFYAKHLTGRRTASGERYDPKAMTAAHRTLPMGTKLRVTNPRNQRSVVVTVNDRGRLPSGRVVDVSSAAADALGMKKNGVARVETQVVGRRDASRNTTTTSAADPATAATR